MTWFFSYSLIKIDFSHLMLHWASWNFKKNLFFAFGLVEIYWPLSTYPTLCSFSAISINSYKCIVVCISLIQIIIFIPFYRSSIVQLRKRHKKQTWCIIEILPFKFQLFQNLLSTLKFKLIIVYFDFLFKQKMCQLVDLSQGCCPFRSQLTCWNRNKISKNKNCRYPVSGFHQTFSSHHFKENILNVRSHYWKVLRFDNSSILL